MAGYIGTAAVPQATQKRQAFTATAGQTSFATSGYSVGFVDVYMNGVKLAAADYTATNGSDVVLATAALVNDIVEIVAFTSFVASGGLAAANNLSDVVSASTALTNLGVASTAAELNQLDAITRGSILYGNASGATARLAKGAADTVLTSDGTDISWGSSGTPFAGGYLAVTSDVTLTAGQSGYQIYVTGDRLITLPAVNQSVYYIIKNGGSDNIYLKPNGSQTLNGFASAIRLIVSAGSDIIIINDGVSNWQTISNTVGSTLAEATTITTSQTFTPKSITTSLLVCVSGSSCGVNSPTSTDNSMQSGGAGGPSYAEKFISSPASSYVVSIGTFGDVNGSAGSNTTAAGITCPPSANFAARYTSSNGTGKAGGAAGTGGTFSAAGGNGASRSGSGLYERKGGGGGAGTRAGVGGNAGANSGGSAAASHGGTSGGTGGNNGADNQSGTTGSGYNGVAATAKDSGSYVVSGITSETYQSGDSGLGGAGAQTIMNWNGGTFIIAEGRTRGGTNGMNYNGHDTGQNNGAYGGLSGTVTFVEFF